MNTPVHKIINSDTQPTEYFVNESIDPNEVIALEFSMDIDCPGRYQTSDGEWHIGQIPSKENL